MGEPSFSELSKMNYKQQGIWFTNGFYGVIKADMEKIYTIHKKFVELDKLGPAKKGEDGNELDNFWSAKLLEDLNSAMPALERKEALKTIDVDSNGCVSFIEYLAWTYKQAPNAVTKAPQGDNQEAIDRAQKKMEVVQRQLEQVLTAIDKLKVEQEELAKLKKELEEAVAALKAEEDAYAKRISDLEAAANDPRASTVKKSRSANELAQAKAEDPLPLRRAKITQEAAQRRVQKERKALEEAFNDLEAKMLAAREQLDAVKAAGGGGGYGALWWMERQMYEADSRLPNKRQKYDHSKPFSYDPAAGK